MRYVIVALFLVFFSTVSAQSGKLVSGPVQGHITASTAKISLVVKNAKVIRITLNNREQSSAYKTIIVHTDTLPAIKNKFPAVIEFTGLEPGLEYDIMIHLDGKAIDKKFILKTLKSAPVADFSFLTGSCAMQLTPLLRPFTRMGSNTIFRHMRKVPSDFMIWLGDYTYYIKQAVGKDDYTSFDGMWRRQMKTRKIKNIHNFLISRPQYAIWDDHDYGSYDADKDFALKDTSLFIHKMLWANPSYGLPDTKGIFTSFRKYDSEFFLLDDRFYRTQPNIKGGTMLGESQLQWLFEGLKKSDATFKFIVLGTQFLNPCSPDECYNQFAEEKKKIYDFLEKNKIQGVLFISGDSHYADLQKEKRENAYPIYDFTCSPLTSFLDSPLPLEKANTARVPGTLTHHRNFGKVSVTGPEGKRVCSIELYDDNAKLLWRHDIPESELR
ncbi:MAG: alkaline phosphatase D family protein [Bacteroidia bacterium]